jgi:Tfp pilus assembly protein PilV
MLSKDHKKTGFTLVEALVAVSILMVAVVSPMSIAQRGLTSAIYSKDQMTASFLVQDALEFIKNRRDQVGLSNQQNTNSVIGDWLNLDAVLKNCINMVCDVDTANSITVNGTIPPLKMVKNNDVFMYYGHPNDNSIDSRFTRTITITWPAVAGGNTDEALVDVKVSWDGGQSVEMSDYIYNYWENLK